jgi:hypothetical protein
MKSNLYTDASRENVILKSNIVAPLQPTLTYTSDQKENILA